MGPCPGMRVIAGTAGSYLFVELEPRGVCRCPVGVGGRWSGRRARRGVAGRNSGFGCARRMFGALGPRAVGRIEMPAAAGTWTAGVVVALVVCTRTLAGAVAVPAQFQRAVVSSPGGKWAPGLPVPRGCRPPLRVAPVAVVAALAVAEAGTIDLSRRCSCCCAAAGTACPRRLAPASAPRGSCRPGPVVDSSP